MKRGKKRKTGREISSGGVIYKKVQGGIRVALISRKKGEIWCLPKGKVEKPERPEETALREVQEETGLRGRVEEKIGDIKYSYYAKWDNTFYFKVVSFYLVKHTGGSTQRHDWEVDEVKWFSMDEALKVMTYKSEREIVAKAGQMLKAR